MMNKGFKILASLAACVAILALARSALADNRAYSARSAVLDDPNDAGCFAHPPGDPT